MDKIRNLVGITALVLLAAGCGKPPAPEGGGGGGDYPVPAVVGAVVEEDIREGVSLVGTLMAKDTVKVVSELDGTVVEVPFEEGGPVTEGQPLVKLDEVRLKARLNEALARFRLAENDFKRGRELLQGETISQQEFDRLESTYLAAEAAVQLVQEDLNDAVISAPFDGVSGERMVSTGQYVSRGDVVTRVVKMDPLEAVFSVPERYIRVLSPGQQVEFEVAAFPEEAFTGTVFFIAPEVDTRSRAIRVKAEVPNAEGRLKPGMFGRLELTLKTHENGLTIPESALKNIGDAFMVVKVGDDQKSAFQPVQVGRYLDGRVQILDGLKAGDRVVVEGHQKMGPGMTVLATPDSVKYGVEPTPMPEG